MGKSAEELRYDIAGTREHLGSTLDAIGDRVSPSRVIERKKNRLTMGTRTLKDRVMGTMSDAGHSVQDTMHDLPDTVKHTSQGSPMLAGGVAFGIGLLAAAAFPATDVERQATASLMEKAEPIKQDVLETAHEVADHLKQPATDALEEVKASASDAAGHVAETGKQSMHDTASQVTSSASELHTGD